MKTIRLCIKSPISQALLEQPPLLYHLKPEAKKRLVQVYP